MPNITSGTNTPQLGVFYQRVFIENLEANLIFDQFPLHQEHPLYSGKRAYWLEFKNLETSAFSISESFDPATANISTAQITADIVQVGRLYQPSDLFKDTSVPGTMEQFMARVGYQAAITIDARIRNTALTAGGSAQFAGTAVSRNSMSRNAHFRVDIAELREAKATLRRNNVPTFEDGFYAAIIGPDTAYDIEGDSNWVDMAKYTEKGINRLWKGELGTAYRFRFIETTQVKEIVDGGSAAASADVFQSYLFGPGWYGVSTLQSLQIYIDDPDPTSALRLRSRIGWKAGFATKELNSTKAVRLEATTSLGG